MRLAQLDRGHVRVAEVSRAGFRAISQVDGGFEDAQRAVGMVRQHAAEWHIDPQRIGVLGFSAGAHLAAALSTHFNKRLYDPSMQRTK